MGNATVKDFKERGLLSTKEMSELHHQILKEYPFLSNVYESMLVADNNRPDCPIVWANDQFEAMTLYSKEEILGKNCRFLQGKYTDRNLVGQIRKAVDEGKPLDVEILNYRKDGVAFWNCFMMLPVHLKGTTKPSHFIAIQKDVTLLKEIGPEPLKWSPPEVGMWMEQNGFGRQCLEVVTRGIDGAKLMELDWVDLPVLGLQLSSEQKKLMSLIDQISKDGKQRVGSAEKMYKSPSSSSFGFKEFWNSAPQAEKLVVKCFSRGKSEPTLLLMEGRPTFSKLQTLIESAFGHQSIIYKEDDCRMEVTSDEDFQGLVLLHQNTTLSLHLEHVPVELPETSTEMLDSLPVPILLTDPLGYVIYLNQSMRIALGQKPSQKLTPQHISVYIPEVEGEVKRFPSEGQYVDYVVSGVKKRVFLSVAQAALGTFSFTFLTAKPATAKANPIRK